jgi:chorismate-pyruvate lyase
MYKTAYTVHFVCNDFDVVKLSRKLERQYKNKNHVKNKRIYIRNYKIVESRPVYCITVNDDEHLFLAGRSLIPTHNCSEKNTIIKVRNKKTGEIIEMTFEEFHNKIKQKEA